MGLCVRPASTYIAHMTHEHDVMITVTVNDENHQVPEGSTVAYLCRDIGLDPEKVAVERNLEIVPRSTLEEALIRAGDTFEIVHFVGGG